MAQREVPHREGFKFGITGVNPSLVLVIELGKAGRHFPAAGAGRRDDHQRAAGFNILILAKPLFADDEGDIVWITLDRIMQVDRHAELVQHIAKFIRHRLRGILGDDNAAHKEPHAAESVNEAEHIRVIGNAEIAAHLTLFDIGGVDHDHDFSLLFELKEHINLAVRLESRQHARGVIVIKQLTTQLQI